MVFPHFNFNPNPNPNPCLIYMAYKVESLKSSIRWFFHILIFWLAKKIDTFLLHLTRGCPSKNTTTILASSFALHNNIEWSGRLDAFTQFQFCATKPWRNRDYETVTKPWLIQAKEKLREAFLILQKRKIHSKIVFRPERKAVFYSVQRTSLSRTNDRTT
jgi:hypothetical protein